MPIVLAIEPDRRQAAHLTAIVRHQVGAELLLADTTEGALDAIGDRIPDLVLVPALLFGLMCYWPLRLDVSGRARGEADGSWVVAGGISLAATSLAFVWGKRVSPRLTFLLLGRTLTWKPDWHRKLARPVADRLRDASRRPWRTGP